MSSRSVNDGVAVDVERRPSARPGGRASLRRSRRAPLSSRRVVASACCASSSRSIAGSGRHGLADRDVELGHLAPELLDLGARAGDRRRAGRGAGARGEQHQEGEAAATAIRVAGEGGASEVARALWVHTGLPQQGSAVLQRQLSVRNGPTARQARRADLTGQGEEDALGRRELVAAARVAGVDDRRRDLLHQHLGGRRAGGEGDAALAFEPRGVELADVVDQVRVGAGGAGDLDHPVRVRGVARADDQDEVGAVAAPPRGRRPGGSAWRSRCRWTSGPRAPGSGA